MLDFFDDNDQINGHTIQQHRQSTGTHHEGIYVNME